MKKKRRLHCTLHVVFAKTIFMRRKKIKALSNLNNGFKLIAQKKFAGYQGN